MSREGTTSIAAIGMPDIRKLIYTIRGRQVMLDSDLANLYQVETGALNRAAKRNENRFPEDFRFKVEGQELESLRCQFGILRGEGANNGVGRTYLPYVYTEMGVAMLAGVLKSAVAIEVSIRIMRAFVEMRRFITGNADMFNQIQAIELQQLRYQKSTDERFERVFDYMEEHEAPNQKIFFDGQVYDAFEFLIDLVRRANKRIVLIDSFIDTDTLNILAKKNPGVSVEIWTRPTNHITQRDIEIFNAEYPVLSVCCTQAFHDRFLVLDDAECYLVGASLKDAGKRTFGLARIEDVSVIPDIIARLER